MTSGTERRLRSDQRVTNVNTEMNAEALLPDLEVEDAIGHQVITTAHEMNNILTMINLFTELTMQDVVSDGHLQPRLQEILREVLRGKNLVTKLLNAPHHDELAHELLHVEPILQEVLEQLRRTFPQNIQILEHIDPDVSVIHGSSTQIYQVMMNLFRNAEHAMLEHGGILDVTLEDVDMLNDETGTHGGVPRGCYVRLTIRDTGHGISPDIKHRILQPFFTTKGRGKGIGLGLHIVQDIIQKHSGRLTLESIEGRGTAFQVYLPQAQQRDTEPKLTMSPIMPGNMQ